MSPRTLPDHHYVEVLKQRIAAADRSEFASEEEVEAFFAGRDEQDGDVLALIEAEAGEAV